MAQYAAFAALSARNVGRRFGPSFSCVSTMSSAPGRLRPPGWPTVPGWGHHGTVDALESPCRVCGSRSGERLEAGWACAVCGWCVGEFIDPDLPLPRVDVVYYLRRGSSVKIGTTFNPRQRFAALAHDEVLAFELGDRTMERARHADFSEDRLGTSEWFDLSPRLRAHIAALAGGRDPWDVHARWLADALRKARGGSL